MSCVRGAAEDKSEKMCINLQEPHQQSKKGQCQKRELEKEKSSDSSTNSNSENSNSNGTTKQQNGAMQNGGGYSKLSKIGRRLRESCRTLRKKSGNPGACHNPEEYTSIQALNESTRSKHYVPMDFSGDYGRIVDSKELIRGYTSKDGYAYFRKKICPKKLDQLLTDSQATIHLKQIWFHKGVGRDFAQRVLNTHSVNGAFMVRESSVSGGFVISYVFNKRTFHAQVLPDTDTEGHVTYSLDEGRTKFYDLLQMVDFYQLNKGSLQTKLTHYIIRGELPRPESPTSRSEASSSSADSEASMESQSSQSHQIANSHQITGATATGCAATQEQHSNNNNINNNINKEKKVNPGASANELEEDAMMTISASSNDLEMASEGDNDSMREGHQG